MAVSVSNTSSGTQASGASLTFAHNSDTDFLVVCVGANVGSYSITGVTYNGVAMTQAVAVNDGVRGAAIYYLISPASGSHNVVVTMGTSGQIGASAASLSGVHNSSPLGSTGSTTTNSADITLSSINSGSMVLDALGANYSSGSPSAGAGQTVLQNTNITGNIYTFSSYEANETTMSYGGASTLGRAYVAAEFEPALAPTVTTGTFKDLQITQISTIGNNATDDGGATITERGVVLDTATAPEITDTKYATAGTTGSYNTDLTSLTANTLYYVRAFVTNSVGTSYGAERTFTTDEDKATGGNLIKNPITFS